MNKWQKATKEVPSEEKMSYFSLTKLSQPKNKEKDVFMKA